MFRMPLAQGLPADLRRLPNEGLRLLKPARIRQKVGEVVEPNGVIRMPFAQGLPAGLQRLPVERLRLLIPARIHQKVGEAAECRAGPPYVDNFVASWVLSR